MAKITKEKQIAARVSSHEVDRINVYCEATDMGMGELIRKAVAEYMLNHPARDPQPTPSEKLKPGE